MVQNMTHSMLVKSRVNQDIIVELIPSPENYKYAGNERHVNFLLLLNCNRERYFDCLCT